MPGINSGIGRRVDQDAGASWSSYWTRQSEFFLDGTIITVGSDKYFKDKSTNGRNFLITGYDFASDWASGFPYKSAATISAPAGDAALIAADINNFLYAVDGTPNSIPVVSLFQDIDYEHKIFCKHVARVVDANLCEVTQPRVSAVFMATDVLTGADLTKAQTDFSVPAEVTAKWIDPANGNNAWAGTKAAPYKTFATAIAATASGGTIYVKTGTLSESCMIINKGVTVIGVGRVLNNFATNYCFFVNSNITAIVTIRGFWCDNNNAAGITIAPSTADTIIEKCRIYATLPIQCNDYDATTVIKLNDSYLHGGSRLWFKKVTIMSGCLVGDIGGSVASVLAYYNFTSSYNYYKANPVALIQHQADVTEVSMFNDTLNGNVFLDQAIATEKTITINRCRLISSANGRFIKSTNAANKINWVITNNTFTEQGKATAQGLELAGYDITITGNTITNYNGNYYLSSLAVGKTCTFSNNTCISIYDQSFLIYGYTVVQDRNIVISEGFVFNHIMGGYVGMPATISNNLFVSKTEGIFVYLGTVFTNTTDGHLNGSEIYNNRFSGPADWGNPIGSMEAIFSWNQQANWHHNYISGSFLVFTLKSNGGTYAHQVHHNILQNNSMSFTVKGTKGCLIYNNTCKDSAGYDGLSESGVGWEGDSGDSIIKNNIFDLNNGLLRAIKIEDATDASGVISDHNVLHNPANNLIGVIGATSYVLADWQTAGYDGNGSGANPNLDAALIPAASIGIGEDLGAAYDDGLDISTVWSLNALPVVVTKQQGATWQVGAYVQ